MKLRFNRCLSLSSCIVGFNMLAGMEVWLSLCLFTVCSMKQSSSSGSAADLILQWVCIYLVTSPCLGVPLFSPAQGAFAVSHPGHGFGLRG